MQRKTSRQILKYLTYFNQMNISALWHFFLFVVTFYYLGDKQFIRMNPAKLAETISNLTEKYNEYVGKIEEFREKYQKKITELQEKLNELNELKDKSQQFIDTERKKIEKQIDELKANVEKKVQEMMQTAKEWVDDQIETIKTKASADLMAKFGIDIDVDELMKSLKK